MSEMLPKNLKKMRADELLPVLTTIIHAYAHPEKHEHVPDIAGRTSDMLTLMPIVTGRVNRDVGDDALHAEITECLGGVMEGCEHLTPAAYQYVAETLGDTAEIFVTRAVFSLMEYAYADRLEVAGRRLTAMAASGHLRPRVLEPLTDVEQAIYDLLPEPPAGIMSAALLRQLYLRGHDVRQGNLSGRHIAALKVKRGVSNTPGVGYHR